MIIPRLISRSPDDELSCNTIANPRLAIPVATTTFANGEKEHFSGAANGMAAVEKFDSNSTRERGGIILRFLVANEEQSKIPYGVNINQGVEVHLAGETEARYVSSIAQALGRLTTTNYCAES